MQGKIAQSCWREIPEHYPMVTLDAFVLMPDHVHGIIIIGNGLDPTRAEDQVGGAGERNVGAQQRDVGAQHAAPLHVPISTPVRDAGRPAPGSLGTIIRAFKAATTKRLNELAGTPGKAIWQRNYYDRIIRNGQELLSARHYILLNPRRWIEAGTR
jgi:REP-associated tyrosine transposase